MRALRRTPRQLTARVLALSATCLTLLGVSASPAFGVGGAVTSFGGRGVEAGRLLVPGQLAVNRTGTGGVAAGDVYVADTNNNRVQEFSASGQFVRAFGWDVVQAGPDNTGADEQQTVTVPSSVSAGTFQLTVTSATGQTRYEEENAEEIASETATGAFQVGDALSGPGIAPGTTITAVAAHTLTLSQGVLGGFVKDAFLPLTATETTAPIPYNASAAQLAEKLEALAAIGTGGVTVSGGPGASEPFLITFIGGALAHNEIAQMSAASSLSGGSAAVTTTTPGGGPEVCEADAVPADACGPGTPGKVAAGSVSGPQGLAIDQANGNIYITDEGALRTDVFSATGEFEGGFGWNVKATGGAEELQFCTLASGCKAGSSGSGAGQMLNLATSNGSIGYAAVSPLNGHLLIANNSSRRVDEFAPVLTGEVVTGVSFVRGYGWGAKTGAEEFQICTTTCHVPASEGSAQGQFGLRAPQGVAVDATGRVYAVDTFNDRVQTFSSEGQPLGNFAPATLNASKYSGPETVSIDPTTGNVLVSASGPSGRHPLKFDSTGNLLETYITDNSLVPVSSLVEGNAGTPYVNVNSTIYALGTIVPPEAEIESVNTPSGTSAEIKAKVNPVGLEGAYRLEFSTDGGVTWSVKASGEFPADNADHQITATITGLTALTEYQVRVVAEKVFASGKAEDVASFTTPAAPPLIIASGYSDNTDSCVNFKGSINPENQASSYEFEYVSEAQFKASGYANAASVPQGGGQVPAGAEPVPLSEQACGLVAGTTYHFRLSAENPAGQATGPDSTFTTFRAAGEGMPDDRAYEQASPVSKNGTNVQGALNTVQAARGGGGVTFYSGSGLPGSEGSQDYPIFLASRAAGGWSTQGLLPPTATGPRGQVMGWSEDLKQAYDLNFEPDGPVTIYRRDNATHQLLEIATDPNADEFKPSYAASSADGNEVLFEDATQLAPGAMSGRPNAYLWDQESEEVILAGVLNNGVAPAKGSFARGYDWYNSNNPERGSPSFYTAALHTLSEDGASVYFTAAGTGQIYLRRNPTQPQSPLDGEGNCTVPTDACTVQVSASKRTVPDPNGEKPAAFAGATPDGSKVFFMSASQLTNDATTGPSDEGKDLYAYDASTGQLKDLIPDSENAKGAQVKGVLGYSDDGSYVYFAARGGLAGSASGGTCTADGNGCSVYLWHEETVSFIGGLGNLTSDRSNWAPAATDQAGVPTPRTAQASTDGKTLLFSSSRKLTAYENKGVPELYRYRVGEGLDCVSCNPTDAPPDSGGRISSIPDTLVKPTRQAAVLTRNLSADGNRVFFDTTDKLLSTDTNGVNDVYEWEAKGTGSCASEADNGGCLYLLSTGTSSDPSYFGDASVNGDDAFFFTFQPLVGQDKDELADVYDARVGGGIAAQSPPKAPICEDEACRGAASSPPAANSAGSASFSGPANPASHRKKHAKKHKKAHKKHAKQKGRARQQPNLSFLRGEIQR